MKIFWREFHFRRKFYLIENLSEMNFYFTAGDMLMLFGFMYQYRYFLRSDFSSTVSEYKQHRIDNITFTATIRTNDA